MGNAKKWLDVLLLVLFFLELGGMFLPHLAHEVAGCAFLALLLLHNVANRHFYRNFFHGAYRPLRWVSSATIVLLAASLALLAVSGMALSQNLFAQIHIPGSWNWRSLHLGAAISALVLLFAHLLVHARRYIRGRAFFGMAGTAFVLAAVGIFGLPYLDRWYHQVSVDRQAVVQGEKAHLPGRVLTVYFSRVGNTDFPPDVDAVSGASVMKDGTELIGNAEMIACMVQDAAGGDIFAIRTEKTYPADYGETVKEAGGELERREYPALREPFPRPEDYDVIVFVYPLWWDTLPMPAAGFLKQWDLSGKTVVPVVTHGGGGAGKSLEALREATRGDVLENALDIYSSDIPASRQKIADWLTEVSDRMAAR